MRSGRWLLLYVSVILLFLFIGARIDAQPSSRPTSSDPRLAQFGDGKVSGNMYHNADVGLRYEFPEGWIVSDKTTLAKMVKAGHQFVWADDMSEKMQSKTAGQCSRSLLFVSRYPAEMRTNGFNPFAFLIAADPGCLPGASFPTSVNDREAIQRIASHLGTFFKASASTSMGPARVRVFENTGRVMLEVSQPFTINSHEPGSTTIQNIRSSIWIVKAEKCWIMLMFASPDEVQLEKLKTTKIFFDSGAE